MDLRLHRRTTSLISVVFFALLPLQTGLAQQPDTLEMALPEITVDAVRATESTASAPYAVGHRIRSAAELNFEPATSLQAVLRPLPGVWINERGHYALGERLSVRGTGARAAFGVRGVQVLVDGIPLTVADGQAVLDGIEPAVVRSAELLRSPASLFWGNGSGGVLFLSSGMTETTPTVRARALTGGYGQRQFLFEGTTPLGSHHVHAYASNVSQDGYRQYSHGSHVRAGAIGRFQAGPSTLVRTIVAAAVLDTEAPGSLTRTEFEQDARRARPGYPESGSGKQSTQAQAGISVDHEMPAGTFSGTVYGIVRDLDNPLPFAFVDLGRTAGGLRAAFQRRYGRLQWGVGGDAALQHDVRKNWNNAGGSPGTNLLLDQVEDVVSAGAFAYARYQLTSRVQTSAGVRRSTIRFSMDDHLQADGDESGERSFAAWSPAVGVSVRTGPALLYANYSTAFETPTTTELVNRPDMTGGFNTELDPQISRGIELGVRGVLGRVFFDVAAFRMNVDGRLVSFQNELGREFYRNAGENVHTGLEAGIQWQPMARTEFVATYTAGRYEFRDEALRGKLLPGVPEHRLYASLQTGRGAFWGRLEFETVSEYFVDDANAHVNEGYVVVDLHAGLEGVRVGSAHMRPFAALRNVFDARYSGSVVVNAFGGRYFEPSPGRSVVAGFQVSL